MKHFELALTISKILAFDIFNLEKVGQGQSATVSMVPYDGKYQNL